MSRITELEAENKLAKTCLKELQSDCIHYSGLSTRLEAAIKEVTGYCPHYDTLEPCLSEWCLILRTALQENKNELDAGYYPADCR